MSLPCAPTAMRMPISRVRSVTLTSMMFIIPMPPTTSDTNAIAASKYVIVLDCSVAMSAISCWLRTVKSSSCPGVMRWRWRSSSLICSCTGLSSNALAVCALMVRSVVTRETRFIALV